MEDEPFLNLRLKMTSWVCLVVSGLKSFQGDCFKFYFVLGQP